MTRGVTLVELLVVLTLMGIVLGISGLALASLRLPRETEAQRLLQRARTKAISTGRPVVTPGHPAPDTGHRLFLPDGRAVGPNLDLLTGAFHASTR